MRQSHNCPANETPEQHVEHIAQALSRAAVEHGTALWQFGAAAAGQWPQPPKSWASSPRVIKALAKEQAKAYAAEMKRRQDAYAAVEAAEGRFNDLNSELLICLRSMAQRLGKEAASHHSTATQLQAARNEINDLRRRLQTYEAEDG